MALANKSDRLGEEKISTLLIKLSIPAITGMIIQALYNIIDSIYIGRLSTEALSALSLCMPVQLIIISLGVGTGVGASSLISRLLGQGRNHRANNAAEHIFLITILYGIITGVVGFFFAQDIIRLFTDDPQLIKLAGQYIKVILTGSLAVYIPVTFNYILRGEGNTFVPMLTLLIGAILNIILDPFMIFGIGFFPQLGVAGAAYATVSSRLIGGIFITLVILSDKNEINLDLKEFNFDWSIIREIYQVGFPAMVNRILFSLALVAINKILGTFSTTAIAVMGIIFRLQSFFLMAVFGLNQGYLPLVGYNFGHNNPERMKRTIWLGSLAAFSFGIFGFLIFQIFPASLIKLFNNDPQLLNLGVPALKRVSIAYLFMTLNIVGAATFQAIGKGLPSLLVTFLRQIALLLPSMYFLGQLYGLNATWLAFLVAEGLTLVVMLIWQFSIVKKSLDQMKAIKANE
ncbi:MATE family efflux transporter [Halanaerobaculum tunisiense]